MALFFHPCNNTWEHSRWPNQKDKGLGGAVRAKETSVIETKVKYVNLINEMYSHNTSHTEVLITCIFLKLLVLEGLKVFGYGLFLIHFLVEGLIPKMAPM